MQTHTFRHSPGLVAAGLLLGPLTTGTALFAARGTAVLAAGYVGYAVLAAILLWSPLPISLPAVVLGDARDSFRLGQYGVRRSLALYPHLLSAASGARVATWCHLAGFGGLLAICAVLLYTS